MSDRFVIIHRTYDPIQADLLGDLLRDAGIAARVTGTRSGAAIGVAQNILEVHIAVPEPQAGQATDFLEAYFMSAGPELEAELAAAAGAPDDDEDAAADQAAGAARGEALRPLIAAGAAFVTFGVGHVYARRPWTAAALASGQLVALYFLFIGQSWGDWTIGVTMLGGLVACDLVGSALAVRAHNRGARRSGAWQAGVGVLCAAGAMGLALIVGPELADPTRGPGADRSQPRRSDQGQLGHPFERDPSFPPLTSEHPANPQN